MLKHSLVYIHAAEEGERFVGCGAYIEQNLIATCRHVWRDAGEAATAVFPHLRRNGQPFASALKLVHECKPANGDGPDLVLLRPVEPPTECTEAQVARDEPRETGLARALTWLDSRETDETIEGTIDDHLNASGRRKFLAPTAVDHWLEEGSSGSLSFSSPASNWPGSSASRS